jgi:glycine hydroxymethyltransferase
MKNIKKTDPQIYKLIKLEIERRKFGLEMIPSENHTSKAVLEALGSILTDKYSEGYPGKRYYEGNRYIDEIEKLCQERAKKLFGANDYCVNVQSYSGSPANLAVYTALLNLGDKILSLRLDQGGHLTHGNKNTLSGKLFNFIHYNLDEKTSLLNYSEIAKLAKKEKPKMILSGFTAYPRIVDFKKIHLIAKEVGAISMADISHIAGLIVGKVHPSPFPFTDIVTTTTHKTLRGPRSAIIFCKKEFEDKINKAVFPGIQGGPHENNIAGVAVALKEASLKGFKNYAKQIVKNAKELAKFLMKNDIKLVSNGTDNHLVLIDLRNFGVGSGIFVEKALEAAGITVNKNAIPNDPSPPYYPSGIRLGTPALTTRGMKEKEMRLIAYWISLIIKEFARINLPEDKDKRKELLQNFSKQLEKSSLIKKIKLKVKKLSSKFPIPNI